MCQFSVLSGAIKETTTSGTAGGTAVALDVRTLEIGIVQDARVGKGGSGRKGCDKCVSEVAMFLVDCYGVVGRTWSKRISFTKSKEDCKDDRSACVRAWISGFKMVILTLQGSVGDCYFLAALSAVVELRVGFCSFICTRFECRIDSVLGQSEGWYRLRLLFSFKLFSLGRKKRGWDGLLCHVLCALQISTISFFYDPNACMVRNCESRVWFLGLTATDVTRVHIL